MAKYYTVYDRLKKIGISASRHDLNDIGKMMVHVYRKQYRKDPLRVMHEEEGKMLIVFAYRYHDTPMLDKTIHRFYKKKLKRIIGERNKPRSKPPVAVLDQLAVTSNNVDLAMDQRKIPRQKFSEKRRFKS